MQKGRDRLTRFGEIGRYDVIIDQSETRYYGYYCRAYSHPERFTVSETVVGFMLDSEGDNSHDVQ
jgi:hypothetical protein